MVEWSGTQHEVGVQSECGDPVRVVLECEERTTFLGVPNTNCAITASGIEHAFGSPGASPLDNIDAGRMSAEGVFEPAENGVPDPDGVIL